MAITFLTTIEASDKSLTDSDNIDDPDARKNGPPAPYITLDEFNMITSENEDNPDGGGGFLKFVNDTTLFIETITNEERLQARKGLMEKYRIKALNLEVGERELSPKNHRTYWSQKDGAWYARYSLSSPEMPTRFKITVLKED